MTTTFDRTFSAADIIVAAEKILSVMDADDLRTICAGDLRNGMQIVEKVQGKRRYFTVWGHPVIRGHEVRVTVSVNGHKLNWRYEFESPVRILEGN